MQRDTGGHHEEHPELPGGIGAPTALPEYSSQGQLYSVDQHFEVAVQAQGHARGRGVQSGEKTGSPGQQESDEKSDDDRAKNDGTGSDEEIADVIVNRTLAAVFNVSKHVTARFVPLRFEGYEFMDLVTE